MHITKDELKRRLSVQRDVETQRERRQSDPAYRQEYNAMRRAYYAKKKDDPKYMAKLREKRRARDKKKKHGKRTDEVKANERTELSSGK